MKFAFATLAATLSVSAQLVPSADHPKIQIPQGLTLTQYADNSKVVTPTTLCIDDNGRVFVSETFRWRKQVQDIRHGGENNRYLRERIEDDISSMTRFDRMRSAPSTSTIV